MTTIIHPPALAKAPCERDQRIFLAVHGLGKLQAEAAVEFGVSQGRVSQICKRVKRWRAGLKPPVSEEHEQARLDLYLKRETLREMRAEALREHRRAQRPLKTVRKRVRHVTVDGKRQREVEFIETTIREQPVRMQSFNTALKIMEMEEKLAERKPATAPEEQDDPLWYMLWEMVISARTHAEKDYRVNPCGDKHALAEHVLGIVYGKDVRVAPRPPSVVKKRPEGAKPTRYEPDYEEETENRGQGTGNSGQAISGMGPEANKVNTTSRAPEAEITPEEAIRLLEEACATGTYLSDADRAVLQKQIDVEREKLADIREEGDGSQGTGDRSQGTAAGSGDPRTAVEMPEPRRRRFVPTPPEDYGWRPSVPSKEWLEGERERRRECLKALVPVVTEGR